ncbi:MAG: O-antigen ligase family protein [Hydrogenophilales bacterium]
MRSSELYYSLFSTLYFFVLIITFFYYLNGLKIESFKKFVHFFKLLFSFYIIDIIFQITYHNIPISKILELSAFGLSSFSTLFIFSCLLQSSENYQKIKTFFFYILNTSLIVGILNSVGIINNALIVESKGIESYNFGIFSNTAGLFDHPITYGLSIVLLLALYFDFKKINFINHLFLLLGVFISFSRTAWLLYFIVLFYYYFTRSKRKIVFLFFSFFIIVVFSLMLFDNEVLFSLFRVDKFDSGRLLIVSIFLEMIDGNFLTGVGYGNLITVRDLTLLDSEYNLKAFQFSSLHNLYISTIAQSGIILAVFYFYAKIKIFLSYFNKKVFNKYSLIFIVFTIYLLGNLFVEFKIGGIRTISLYSTITLAYIYSNSINMTGKRDEKSFSS